jgi:hypothetical protein
LTAGSAFVAVIDDDAMNRLCCPEASSETGSACGRWRIGPGDCLRLLADLHPDSIDHALQVGLQPPALPGSATSTLSSSSRASQIGHLGMSAPSDPRCVPRRRMRQSVLAAKLAFTQPALVHDDALISTAPRDAARTASAKVLAVAEFVGGYER